MKRSIDRTIFIAVLAWSCVAASQALSAQKPSDLTGKWVFVPDKSQGTPTVPRIFNSTGAPAGSNDLVVTQNPKAVNVKIGGVELVYRLDGTEANISAEGRAGFPVGKAAFEGGKLAVTLIQEVFAPAKGNYIKLPLQETYSVADGLLTLERTRTHVDGKTDVQKLVYKKAS